MTTVWHTPDPVQGAAIDALGGGTALISMPNDDEVVRAAIVRLPTEMLADWIAYLRNKFRRRENEFDNTESGGPALANRYNFVSAPSNNTVFELPASAAADDVCEIAAYSIGVGVTVSVIRNGAPSSIVTFAGAATPSYGYCKVRWFDADWHIVTATSSEAITYGDID